MYTTSQRGAQLGYSSERHTAHRRTPGRLSASVHCRCNSRRQQFKVYSVSCFSSCSMVFSSKFGSNVGGKSTFLICALTIRFATSTRNLPSKYDCPFTQVFNESAVF